MVDAAKWIMENIDLHRQRYKSKILKLLSEAQHDYGVSDSFAWDVANADSISLSYLLSLAESLDEIAKQIASDSRIRQPINVPG